MHYQTESWGPYNYPTRSTSPIGSSDPIERIERLASENAVVIFSVSTCCMCHAIKRLFCGMGVNPTVYELDEDPKGGKEIERALMMLLGTSSAVPSSSLVENWWEPWIESWPLILMGPLSHFSRKLGPSGFDLFVK